MGSLCVTTQPRGQLASLILIVCAGGCEGVARLTESPPAMSSVYKNFQPEEEFLRLGFQINASVDGGRISPREVYGWRPLQGSLVLPAGQEGCEVVAVAIRDALNRALAHASRDELSLDRKRDRGKPFYGMLRYVHEGMRGDVYIWLFPDNSETQISYAMLLHEELLSRGSALRRPPDND